MSSTYVFHLAVRGSRSQREAVAQYVQSRITTNDGNYIIDTDDKWASLSVVDEGDTASLCQQCDDHSAFWIEGGTNAAPGLWLANEISVKFPELPIRIGGEDEEGSGELWEVVSGEPRLLDVHGSLCFSELRFCVKYWTMKNGEEITPDERRIWIEEEVARHASESGIDYTPEQDAIIQREINQLEEFLLQDEGETTVDQLTAPDVSDEEFLKAIEEDFGSQANTSELAHVHTWVAFSTVVADRWIMLQCVDCGLHGTVEDPNSEEWGRAFHAPSRPFQWLDGERVVIHPEVPAWKRYVVGVNPGKRCECYTRRDVIEPHEYERFPNHATRPPIKLTDADRAEVLGLVKIVNKAALCSFLFEVFLKNAARDIGVVHGPAVKEVARRISSLDRKGLHCSPAVVARLLTEIALPPQFPEGVE